LGCPWYRAPISVTALYAKFGSFVPVALRVLVAAVLTGVSILVLTENRAKTDDLANELAECHEGDANLGADELRGAAALIGGS
jgi:hypothetical protein